MPQAVRQRIGITDATVRLSIGIENAGDLIDAYMAHCHLLEHEDTGMMLGFTVS